MSNIFKILLGTTLLAAVVLFLVLGRQERHRADMQLQAADFDRSVAEFNADFERSKRSPDKRIIAREEARAAAAQQQYSSIGMSQRRLEGVTAKQLDDFDKAIKDVDRKLGGGK